MAKYPTQFVCSGCGLKRTSFAKFNEHRRQCQLYQEKRNAALSTNNSLLLHGNGNGDKVDIKDKKV